MINRKSVESAGNKQLGCLLENVFQSGSLRCSCYERHSRLLMQRIASHWRLSNQPFQRRFGLKLNWTSRIELQPEVSSRRTAIMFSDVKVRVIRISSYSVMFFMLSENYILIDNPSQSSVTRRGRARFRVRWTRTKIPSC
jgi:hypothetical protein